MDATTRAAHRAAGIAARIEAHATVAAASLLAISENYADTDEEARASFYAGLSDAIGGHPPDHDEANHPFHPDRGTAYRRGYAAGTYGEAYAWELSRGARGRYRWSATARSTP